MSVFNFSAGPAALPKAVMQKAQAEFLDWDHHGTSVMEMSHRGKPFMAVAEKAEADLRTLLAVPDNYKVLFLQGGGRGQFFSVPLNLAKRGNLAQHLVSGQWSEIAVTEAAKYMKSEVVWQRKANGSLTQVLHIFIIAQMKPSMVLRLIGCQKPAMCH